MLIDFHVHSPESPEVPYTLSDLVAMVKAHGLDGFCMTDVHTVKGGQQAKELAKKEGLLALIGFEAYTDRGHYLVFVPSPETLPEISTWLRFDQQGKSAFWSLVEAVEERNGVLIAAHPFDRCTPESPGDGLMRLKGVSAIEVLNASRPALINDLAEEVAAGCGLPGTGGSDARISLDNIGRFATLLMGDVHTETELIEKILSHDIWPVAIGDPAFEQQPEFRKTRQGARHGQAPQHRRQHYHDRNQSGAKGDSRSRSTTARTGTPSSRSRKSSANPPTRTNGMQASQKQGQRSRNKPPPPKPSS